MAIIDLMMVKSWWTDGQNDGHLLVDVYIAGHA